MLYSLLQQSDTGGSAFGSIVGLVVAIIMIVALWKIFTKAGQPGWAAIIPIYNTLVMLRIIGRPWWWLLLMLIPFVNIVVYIIIMLGMAKSFGHGAGFALGLIFLPFIWYLILGFGGSEYVGPAAGQQAAAPPAPPAPAA